jgi:hypothetical protein
LVAATAGDRTRASAPPAYRAPLAHDPHEFVDRIDLWAPERFGPGKTKDHIG